MLVPWDVLQRKLCCGGACVFQVHSVAVPGVNLFRCQSPGVLEESGLCWVRRCFCLHNSFCNARPLSFADAQICSTSEHVGRRAFSSCTASFSAPKNESKELYQRDCLLSPVVSPDTFWGGQPQKYFPKSSWTANFFALLIILLKKTSACAKADMQPDRTGKKKRNNFLHLPVSLFLKW